MAFPWLGIFTKCGIPNYPKYRHEHEDENHSLNHETGEPLLSKKNTMSVGGKEIAKKSKKKKKNNMGNKDMIEARPLASLGFGIVAYIDILWTLICVFGVFTLMLWPTMSVFHAGTGYKDVNPAMIQYELGTLGNMG